jgi:hypothetical protein
VAKRCWETEVDEYYAYEETDEEGLDFSEEAQEETYDFYTNFEVRFA